MMKKLLAPALLLGTFATQFSFAQNYPFRLPSDITTTVNINTGSQEAFKNPLLGTNIFGFETSKEKELIGIFDPITVRFPHGLWANWYDWETDGTRVFGQDSFQYRQSNGNMRTVQLDHLSGIKQFDRSGAKVGIEGLADLNASKKHATRKGYDMLWTFNMSADGRNFNNGSPNTVARYQDLKRKGFEVKYVELGNENFYPGQRSSIIPNAREYILRAKSMSKALKARDPSIKVSVPLLRRGSWANPNWNKDLTKDQSYYDAVTVHTYVGANPDDPKNGDEAYSTVLTARKHLADSTNNFPRKVAPTKPVWLSEWGVKAGGPNAASVLGMADSYIFLSENQNIYHRANWFSVNGKLNSFLVWEDYTAPNGKKRSRVKYPLQKTAFGSSYEIIRSVFENSTMLKSNSNSPQLVRGVDAVSTRVVVKNGKTLVFAVNLTNKEAPLNVKINGSRYFGSFDHKAMSFGYMGAERVLPIKANPLKDVIGSSQDIRLPKFSINVIHLEEPNINTQKFSAALSAPGNNSRFSLGSKIQLRATASTNTGAIEQVNFRIDGIYLDQDKTAPYNVSWEPRDAGTYNIDVVAIREDGTRKVSSSRTVIVGNARSAYVHLAKANAPGFALDGDHGGSPDQNVHLWRSDLNNKNQHWEELNRGNNYYSYKKRGTEFCLDGGNGGNEEQNVKLWDCDAGNQNQHFRKVSKGGNTFQLRKRNAMGFAIDGGKGGDVDQNVYLWENFDGNNPNQQWKFTPVR